MIGAMCIYFYNVSHLIQSFPILDIMYHYLFLTNQNQIGFYCDNYVGNAYQKTHRSWNLLTNRCIMVLHLLTEGGFATNSTGKKSFVFCELQYSCEMGLWVW